MNPGDRDLSLAPLCAAAATGRRDALVAAARAATLAGCSGETLREALLTIAPFCGYPRTLDAIAAVRPLLPAAVPEAELASADLRSRGAALFDRVYGRDADAVRANLVALDAEVAAWIESDAYGKVLSRPGIEPSLRERIAFVLLAAQGLRNQLSGHARGALLCGATPAELSAFIEAAAPFIAPDELAFARETVARVIRAVP
jgi:4-carboxymuconolactone decarboxylase